MTIFSLKTGKIQKNFSKNGEKFRKTGENGTFFLKTGKIEKTGINGDFFF